MKTAVMFVGQGSQYKEMGLDILSTDTYKEKVLIANDILGYNILEALKNENNELTKTIYTQPLIAIVSMILFDHYESLGLDVEGFLGFSLGEIVALYGSKILTFSETIKLIKVRAQLMEEATNKNPGKMTAVINADEELLVNIVNNVSTTNKPVVIANYNSRKQLVISGDIDSVDKVKELLKESGVKRLIDLNVSGAFHSSLMSEAGVKLNEYSLLLNKNINNNPVYLNSSTKPLDYLNLNNELETQIKSPVFFYQTIESMIEQGYELFVEIGPGKVLSQILVKNYPEVKTLNIENLSDFDKLKGLI